MIKIHKVIRYRFNREKVFGMMVDRGINLQELAKRCGLSSAAVSSWMTGKTEPTMRSLKSVADALKVKGDDLLITPEETGK